VKVREGTCTVKGCDRPLNGKGLCNMHTKRMLRRGRLDLPAAAERFWGFVPQGLPADACWQWAGSVNNWGYGRMNWDGAAIQAHRRIYELTYGPIPEGMVIDHTCHNGSGCPGGPTCPHRSCVNPAHLELVTNKVNTQRGQAPSTVIAASGRCKNGHPFDRIEQRDGRTRQYCSTCRREISRRYYTRKKAA
jgi:hypothetical protein